MAITNKLSAIGDAIREKTGKTELLTLDAMPTEIRSIQTGGEIREVVVSGSDFEWWLLTGDLDRSDGNTTLTPIPEYYNDEIEEVRIRNAFSAFCAKKITLPNLLRFSGTAQSAFGNNIEILEIDMPKVEIIPRNTFDNCQYLEKVNLPKLKIVNDYAFNACKKLKQINLPVCEEVGMSSFYECAGLNTINLPMCTTIKDYAFNNCNNIALTINAPNATQIGNSAFKYFGASTVDFPLVEKIGNNAFEYANIAQANLPNFVEAGDAVFQYCYSLETINLPKMSKLRVNTFRNCSKLKKVDLGCITEVVLSASYNSPFYGCTELETVIIRSNTVAPLGSTTANLFYNCKKFTNGECFIYVPKAIIEDYKVATNWTASASLFRAIEDYPEICG